MLPYFQIMAMITLTFYYSRLYSEYAIFFFLYYGFLLSYMTAQLNLKSTASMTYSPYYAEPIVYFIVLYYDHYKLASRENVLIAYSVLMVATSVKYICFMRAVIIQVCDHLKIPFITVQNKAD